MSSKVPPSDLPVHPFPSAKDFETFLSHENTSSPGIYLKLAKKSSGIPSISGAEAVEVALCYGWIDGRANSFDNDWWLVRYTPRRAKSIWSKKNVETVGCLLEEGRMRPAGLAAVDKAKADGRWERAYAGPATIEVPEDLTAALGKEKEAKTFFEGLNKTNRYAVLWRVETASRKTREKRIGELVKMLAEGKTFHAASKAKAIDPVKTVKAGRVAKNRRPGREKLGQEQLVHATGQSARSQRAASRSNMKSMPSGAEVVG